MQTLALILIGLVAIVGVIYAALALYFGLTFFYKDPTDNYQSLTVRDNVRRTK